MTNVVNIWREHAPSNASLIRCAGCGTYWKAPPMQAEVTITMPPKDWRASDWQTFDPSGSPTAKTYSSVACPLCGGTEIDVPGCQIPIALFERISQIPES